MVQFAMAQVKKELRVVDLFCGAGGFSEGFRQQGFEIVRGVDCWQPAINTHNLNHGLNDTVQDVLDFWGKDSADVIEIERLEDVEFIVGSPSCVSFSMSNCAGKADKTHGVRLIEIFLRVVAVKKHKKGSSLKAWYMENVPKSRNFIREEGYTFEHLNLSRWAERNGFRKTDIALRAKGEVLNACDYGAPQERRRFIAGEWIETSEFVSPTITHKRHRTVSDIRKCMPKVNESKSTKKKFTDPNYPNVQLTAAQLTDHFYDTGVYKIQWEKAEFLKTNHPFMGKMSFPENEDRTSRTITATRSVVTREAILYRSEYPRKGDGEYRLPTIREAASLMGFPYVYQFFGSEGLKWRQIGNSVCPHQSAALARALRNRMGLRSISNNKIDFSKLKSNYNRVESLNTFEEKTFNSPKKRNKDARFRRPALKVGNMTVDLMNYHPIKKEPVAQGWYVVAFFGIGDGYDLKIFSQEEKTFLEDTLKKSFRQFYKYKRDVNNLSVEVLSLQQAYENDLCLSEDSNPIVLLKKLAQIISRYTLGHQKFVNGGSILCNRDVPMSQLMSAYGMLTILDS